MLSRYLEDELESDTAKLRACTDSELNFKDYSSSYALTGVSELIKLNKFLEFSREAISTELNIPLTQEPQDALQHFPTSHSIEEMEALCPLKISLDALRSLEHEVHFSLKQVRRDYDRDKVVINGVHLIGADKGLDGILRELSDCMDRVCMLSRLPLAEDDFKRETGLKVLHLASRTVSGGASLTAFQCLASEIPDHFIVPDSHLAEPVLIRISSGSFHPLSECTQRAHSLNWGLKFQMICPFYFCLKSRSTEVDQRSLTPFRVAFETTLELAADLVSNRYHAVDHKWGVFHITVQK